MQLVAQLLNSIKSAKLIVTIVKVIIIIHVIIIIAIIIIACFINQVIIIIILNFGSEVYPSSIVRSIFITYHTNLTVLITGLLECFIRGPCLGFSTDSSNASIFFNDC